MSPRVISFSSPLCESLLRALPADSDPFPPDLICVYQLASGTQCHKMTNTWVYAAFSCSHHRYEVPAGDATPDLSWPDGSPHDPVRGASKLLCARRYVRGSQPSAGTRLHDYRRYS